MKLYFSGLPGFRRNEKSQSLFNDEWHLDEKIEQVVVDKDYFLKESLEKKVFLWQKSASQDADGKKSGEWSSSPEVKAADWDLSSLAVDTKQQMLEKNGV